MQPWLWARIVALGSAITIPPASFISGIYLMDIIFSVRSAIQLSTQLDKLRAMLNEIEADARRDDDALFPHNRFKRP